MGLVLVPRVSYLQKLALKPPILVGRTVRSLTDSRDFPIIMARFEITTAVHVNSNEGAFFIHTSIKSTELNQLHDDSVRVFIDKKGAR